MSSEPPDADRPVAQPSCAEPLEGEPQRRTGAWAVVGEFLVDPTVDQTRAMARVVGPVFVVCALALVPWTVYLYVSLPSRAVANNHDLSWAGFDVGLVLTLVLTTVALVRRSRWLPVASASLGALLLVDAWFDVLTSRAGGERLAAVVMALLVELPLAVVAYWLAYHGQALRERAIAIRLVRAVRSGRPLRPRRERRLR